MLRRPDSSGGSMRAGGRASLHDEDIIIIIMTKVGLFLRPRLSSSCQASSDGSWRLMRIKMADYFITSSLHIIGAIGSYCNYIVVLHSDASLYEFVQKWLEKLLQSTPGAVAFSICAKIETTLFVPSKLTFSKYLWCLNLALLGVAVAWKRLLQKRFLFSNCFAITGGKFGECQLWGDK